MSRAPNFAGWIANQTPARSSNPRRGFALLGSLAAKQIAQAIDLALGHPLLRAETNGLRLLELDRRTQRLVGHVELLGGGRNAVAGAAAAPGGRFRRHGG